MEQNLEYTVGEGCQIASTAVIGKGCKIGNHVTIHHFAVLYEGTEIGDDCEVFDHAVIGRPPKSTGNLISKIDNAIESVKIGNYSVIGAIAVIYAGCVIGDHVMIGDGASMREGCIIQDNALVAKYVTLNHHVSLGTNSKIMDLTHITSRTTIENNVFIGPGVMTSNDNEMRIKGSPVTNRIILHEGCKIGAGASILPNVKVGAGSIVGSQAVVSRDVKENTRVMGIPAKEK